MWLFRTLGFKNHPEGNSQQNNTIVFRHSFQLFMIEYKIVCGKIVMYDYIRLSWGLDLISLKCVYQSSIHENNIENFLVKENNVVLNGKNVNR